MDDVVLPPLEELLASARVVSLPMRERFRGITVREALLFRGPNGWAEFSPFVEYDDAEAATGMFTSGFSMRNGSSMPSAARWAVVACWRGLRSPAASCLPAHR